MRVAPLLEEYVKSDNAAEAFVIACYGDPGLHFCRDITDRPVFDIAECAISTALTRGGQFGVIPILANSIARHRRQMQERLVHEHCAVDHPLGLSVADVEGGAATFSRMSAVGHALRRLRQRLVLLLGVAPARPRGGQARLRRCGGAGHGGCGLACEATCLPLRYSSECMYTPSKVSVGPLPAGTS